MHWQRLIARALVAAALLAGSASHALAQTGPAPTSGDTGEPGADAPTDADSEFSDAGDADADDGLDSDSNAPGPADADRGTAPGASGPPGTENASSEPMLVMVESGPGTPAGTYEIGAYLGLRGGARVTPGGLSLGGTFLYRVAAGIWSDTSVGVTLAGTSPGCFVERDGERFCDHGVFGGSGLAVATGLRVFFADNQGVTPFARFGVGLEYIAFGDDELDGLAIPAYLGAGVRAAVDERVFVGGAAVLQAGVGFFDQNLGVEPYASLSIVATVEFDID